MKEIKRPSLFLFFTEIFRALLEYRKVIPFIKNYTVEKKRPPQQVLVIPGFMASDVSTQPLRQFLQKFGYETHGWKLGTNFADLTQLPLISQQIDDLYAKNKEPINLIGWSLGGVYAREMAKEQPEKIRQVITLGSPFSGILEPNNANITFRFISWLRGYPELDPDFINGLPAPAEVPTTALYSKKDGIVPWQVCREQVEDEIHENVEVTCSHLGMGVECNVLEIIADRLQYDATNWKKYDEATEPTTAA